LTTVAPQAIADQDAERSGERGRHGRQEHSSSDVRDRGQRKRRVIAVASATHHELLTRDCHRDERRQASVGRQRRRFQQQPRHERNPERTPDAVGICPQTDVHRHHEAIQVDRHPSEGSSRSFEGSRFAAPKR
jgi:hypothetical protein